MRPAIAMLAALAVVVLAPSVLLAQQTQPGQNAQYAPVPGQTPQTPA